MSSSVLLTPIERSVVAPRREPDSLSPRARSILYTEFSVGSLRSLFCSRRATGTLLRVGYFRGISRTT